MGCGMKGKLYGVSTGPGDPELMTLKAVRIIERCSVIAAPITHGKNCAALSIVEGACDLSGKTVIKLEFSMSRDERVLADSHIAAADTLTRYLESGRDVAFVSIGDISVYSTFSYIAGIVRERGYETEVCAGVTSFCAAAAAVGEPLVLGNEPLIVIPAGNGDLENLCSLTGTKVIMKSGCSVAEIKQKLNGRKAFAVENCGYDNQKIYGSIDEIDNKSGYFTTIIVK